MSAAAVIRSQLVQGVWPIFPKTRYQQYMVAGQRLLFYAAGAREYSQHVVGSAKIGRVEESKSKSSDGSRNGGTPQVVARLLLVDVRQFDKPINLKERRHALSFLALKGYYWYASLQGGCALLSHADWDTLQP